MSFKMEPTPEITMLTEKCKENTGIAPELYTKYDVKKGLRDVNGNGVRAGLTRISTIIAKEEVNGESVPCAGRLYFRGIDVRDLTGGFNSEGRFGFEETAYLILYGKLPTAEELEDFMEVLADSRSLPKNFVRDVIMKAPSKDMMNTLARSVLTLYAYDKNSDDTSLDNVMRQCLMLISVFPMLSVYGYHAYNHYYKDKSLYIHRPDPKLSTAENILRMLRPDMKYTELEAQVLDIALVLHMDHGGGNNSTFTTHVISSSGTDTYSVMAAALGSLKGPKHGGANIKVVRMFQDIWKNVHDHKDEEEVKAYLKKILHKEVFDKAGLIYGFGHAIYSVSDPRALIFKQFVEKLAESKHRMPEYELYSLIEKLAPEVIGEERKIYKGVSANVE